MVDPIRIRNGSVKPWSTLGQPWSNLVNLGRFSGNVPRTFVRSGRLGSGCLVLRADTRENPVGKNRVMTAGERVISSGDLVRRVGFHRSLPTPYYFSSLINSTKN